MKEKMAPGHGLSGLNMLMYETMDGGSGFRSAPGAPLQTVFGRINPNHGTPPDESQLRILADSMLEDEVTASNGPAEAGMAFLGQFIDHDLTLDATTELGKAAGDVTLVRNVRTPRLDLDCVYGGGPEVNPYLYDGARLLFGRLPLEGNAQSNPLDLPRNRNGTALIGDPRNDENLFVSQVHGRRFIEKHNQMVDAGSGGAHDRFEHAKAGMIAWYHQIIVEEFLPQIVAPAVLGPLLAGAEAHALPVQGSLNWEHAPDMPVEFSAAAYRFGHSMIRQRYKLNGNPGRAEVDLFASEGGDGVNLRGFHPVAVANNLDMDLFFGPTAQRSRPIDTHLPRALLQLPPEVVGTGEVNLAHRNMVRGQITFALPSGEEMADHMDLPPIAADDRVKAAGLEGNTPLWYYILSEGEQNGGRLGPVGGTLVAGVLLNLMLKGKSPQFPPLVA